MTRPADETEWEAGWDGHQMAQQRRLAALPLWEKLAWLEDAQRLATQLRSGAPDTGTADPVTAPPSRAPRP